MPEIVRAKDVQRLADMLVRYDGADEITAVLAALCAEWAKQDEGRATFWQDHAYRVREGYIAEKATQPE